MLIDKVKKTVESRLIAFSEVVVTHNLLNTLPQICLSVCLSVILRGLILASMYGAGITVRARCDLSPETKKLVTFEKLPRFYPAK